jgi:MFS transporter, OFA family, oxalate/formate antiporter
VAKKRPFAMEASLVVKRWSQLAIGVVCMCMIANMQYGWTLFVTPIDQRHGWGRPAIQIAFTLFVLFETWLVPLEGRLVDWLGPRPVALAGGVLCATGWVISSMASSLVGLYVAAAIGGIGAGAVYGTCIGNALRWFPDRRGLAAGLTAAGFGAGSALTVVPIARSIASHGYERTFFVFGLAQGAAVVIGALLLRVPDGGSIVRVEKSDTEGVVAKQFTPTQMARTTLFWALYAMFVMVASGGLMATAQLAPMAVDFKVAGRPVSVLGLSLPAVAMAMSVDRLLNGITRPFFGWVSDHIGRENCMFIAFGLEGIAILLLARYAQDPVRFVLLSGFVFFAWGEVYSLFPAICCDVFGARCAAANAGLLYTAKGVAALLVPLTSILAANDHWQRVLTASSILNFTSALLALVVIKPLRARLGGRLAARDPQHGPASLRARA